MGDLDKKDMLLLLYHSKISPKKWYLRIASHIFSLTAVNSWILYKELGGSNNLVKFLTELSIDLIQGCPPVDTDTNTDSNEAQEPRQKSVRLSQASKQARFDKYNHWPVQIDCPNAQ